MDSLGYLDNPDHPPENPPHSEPDVDLENQYYNSKALKEKDPNKALESFQKVP